MQIKQLRNPLVLPSVLLVLIVFALLATGYAPPAGRQNWLLEVGPGLLGIVVLVATYSRFRMSNLVYSVVFIHMLVLIYGGYYTYAEAPLGDWIRNLFHLQRNPYDRVGHLALGLFPALITREILLRLTPLKRGGWLSFLTVATVFSVGAFWELLEWWTTLVVAPDVGVAFLGAQGDVWDAQWDMFLVLIGAIISMLLLSRLHDRSLARLQDRMKRIVSAGECQGEVHLRNIETL